MSESGAMSQTPARRRPPGRGATAAKPSAREGLPRRKFLRYAGGAAAGLALAALAPIPIASQRASALGGDGEALRLRRWAMVIDLRRCDGCSGLGLPPQCTQYCNWARFVPEEQEWLEVYHKEENDLPGAADHHQFLPAPCMQCQNAPCVNVCPVGATFHNPEGIVLIDQERCIGCRLCMAACPYDRRFFNWEEPVQPPDVKESPYDVQTQTPAIKGTVMKCDFCTEQAAAGGLPYCVTGCPRGGIYFGDLEEDIATNGKEVVRLSLLINESGALPYKEELGTKPRVYFIQGHGEDVERETYHERDFLRDRVEWPWRKMAAEIEKLPLAAKASLAEDANG